MPLYFDEDYDLSRDHRKSKKAFRNAKDDEEGTDGTESVKIVEEDACIIDQFITMDSDYDTK